MKTQLRLIFALIIVVAFLAVGCSSSSSNSTQTKSSDQEKTSQVEAPKEQQDNTASDPKIDIVYATNPVGTGYYTTSAGQGALLTKKTNINVIVQPTSGPEGIAAALKQGEAQLSVLEPFLLKTFWKDDQDFKRTRTLQAGNVLRFSFVTHSKTGIKTIADLKGRKVTFEGLSQSHKMIAEAILKAYGLDPAKDVTPMKMSFSTGGFEDLIQGRTDAVIASIAGAKIEELASKVEPVVLPVEEQKAVEASKFAPFLMPATIPQGMKLGGTPVVGFISALYVTKEMKDETAYLITKTLVENYQELITLSEELSEWVPEAALTPKVNIPYHPGAIKYYQEKGLWNDKIDQWQNNIIKDFQ